MIDMEEFRPIKKAVIPAAGLGTRMLPATKEIPKELLTIFNRPIIDYIVEEAVQGGITDIIFVTNKDNSLLKKYFKKNLKLEKHLIQKRKSQSLNLLPNKVFDKINFFFVTQKSPLGLGHAISRVEKFIEEDAFAVLLPDEILLSKSSISDFKRMISNFSIKGNGQILVETVSKSDLKKYGIVKLNDKKLSLGNIKEIKDIIEKPSISKAPSNKRVVGRYILPSEIFKYLKKIKLGKDNEFQLTDAIRKILKEKKKIFEATFSNSEIYDCGSQMGFLDANIAIGKRNKEIKKFL